MDFRVTRVANMYVLDYKLHMDDFNSTTDLTGSWEGSFNYVVLISGVVKGGPNRLYNPDTQIEKIDTL